MIVITPKTIRKIATYCKYSAQFIGISDEMNYNVCSIVIITTRFKEGKLLLLILVYIIVYYTTSTKTARLLTSAKFTKQGLPSEVNTARGKHAVLVLVAYDTLFNIPTP